MNSNVNKTLEISNLFLLNRFELKMQVFFLMIKGNQSVICGNLEDLSFLVFGGTYGSKP